MERKERLLREQIDEIEQGIREVKSSGGEGFIEQTMNGRKEKARQGGWNGGFAPYGYYLKDKQLFVQEEAKAIRIIFDKFVNGKKSLISSLIKEIEIFPCDESELPLKPILFNFPVYKDGGDVYEFLWDKSTHVST